MKPRRNLVIHKKRDGLSHGSYWRPTGVPGKLRRSILRPAGCHMIVSKWPSLALAVFVAGKVEKVLCLNLIHKPTACSSAATDCSPTLCASDS